MSVAGQFSYLMSHGRPIGMSRLENDDRSMGVALGAFEPLPAYEEVQAVFQLFADAEDASYRGDRAQSEALLDRYYQARDALELTLQSADGMLIPTEAIHIYDFGAYGMEEMGREVHAHITDSTFWT